MGGEPDRGQSEPEKLFFQMNCLFLFQKTYSNSYLCVRMDCGMVSVCRLSLHPNALIVSVKKKYVQFKGNFLKTALSQPVDFKTV